MAGCPSIPSPPPSSWPESSPTGARVDVAELQNMAEAAGRAISKEEALSWSYRIGSILVARDVAGFTRSVYPPEPLLPDYLQAAVELHRKRAASSLERNLADPTRHFMVHGSGISDYSDYWPMFFYRFVNPRERSGPKANFRARVQSADAEVLPVSGWVIYRCPPLGQQESPPPLLTTTTDYAARPDTVQQ
jgi:hypothetical protein